jgi:hypothetical protein
VTGNAGDGGARVACESPSARVRALIQSGQTGQAAAVAAGLIAETFGLPVASAELTLDEYSLNSVSGRVHFADGHTEFFKFHQEEGEDATVTEYYREQLLEDAGLPVEMPLRVAGEPGRQIALYELRTEPRMADVCLALERAGAPCPQSLRQPAGRSTAPSALPCWTRSGPARLPPWIRLSTSSSTGAWPTPRGVSPVGAIKPGTGLTPYMPVLPITVSS